ncbi:MAG TPA: dienelactone hydrolase family protein [Acidobacteriaceae bacterium]|jgi:dienelactone hydrolase|nr:dienelactone hydrolase family protein [Acidobacteriaceae bacterium]
MQSTTITRRDFLAQSTRASLGLALLTEPAKSSLGADQRPQKYGNPNSGPSAEEAQSTLPGTIPLTAQGDLAAQMVDGIHRFLARKTGQAASDRNGLWKRDYSSIEAYNLSVTANREHFRQIIGAIDPRAESGPPELVGTLSTPALVSQTSNYKIYAVRWHVFDAVTADFDGLDAEGLLLQPNGIPIARVVAIPDADWTPEMLVGLVPGIPPSAQFARRLVESGCQVVVPMIINRDDTFSGIPGIGMTNEPHREWIYRMAYEVGRHIIGFETQKILAAVDWLANENHSRAVPIGIIGYGEGGLLALYSAALDRRIDATVVSGYFQPREEVWKEPIYRDIWGLVREFGDAELASLIAPRALIVEASRGPQVNGPPATTHVHKDAACPNGELITPPLDSVRKEVERARSFFAGLKAKDQLYFVVPQEDQNLPGSDEALQAFLHSMGSTFKLQAGIELPLDHHKNYDPTPRLHRQFDQMVGFTQALIRKSPDRRKEFWSNADLFWKDYDEKVKTDYYAPIKRSGMEVWSASPEEWRKKTKWYRDYIWEEMIGRLPSPNLPMNPRTRLIYETSKFRGYEVMLDVWDDVFAYGILLVPKNIRPDERRPVVVCQHGLEGHAQDVADPKLDSHYYHHFAATLAEEGFVTYAPQNPYIGHDRFRIIQRMGHPLKVALFSFILGQHEQTLNWLAEQPFVDPDRIGFYGLSYGGKTAVRVPPLLDRYALSICSGDFNEWVWKTTNTESISSYLLNGQYDMYEFNLANIANYSELACLMAPRPFMVERGHYDGVGPDETVAFEYSKVRWFYAYMGIPEQTEIEFYDGPHTIHGDQTFKFLRKHLRWPQ